MKEWLVSVSDILGEHGASIDLDEEIALDPLVVGDETFAPSAPAHVEIHLMESGSGIVLFGQIQAPMTAECARCLCTFPLEISGEIEGFYIEPRNADQIPDEQHAEFVRPDWSVDIMPAVLAALVIEAPFAPLHDAECAGLCPECGADLNVEQCDCAAHASKEHPFAALRDLALDDSAPSLSSEQTAPDAAE